MIIVETAGGGSLGKLLGTVGDPLRIVPTLVRAVAMDPGVFKRSCTVQKTSQLLIQRHRQRDINPFLSEFIQNQSVLVPPATWRNQCMS